MRDDGPRPALFVNSGILGHRSVAALFREVAALVPEIDAAHLDLSGALSPVDRVVRRVFSLRLAPNGGPAANLDLRRWREELNVGLLAARRIARLEERVGRFALLHFHTQAAAYGSLRRMRQTPAIVSIDCTQQLASLGAGSRLGQATYLPNVVHDAAVFRRAAAITATSEWAARDLATRHPACAAKVHVMPYPVRAHFGDFAELRAARHGDAARQVHVLFMGGDFPRKGGPELLAAWRAGRLASRASLVLVTDWPLDQSALPEGVRVVRGIAPYSREWIDLWRSADVFVMPTRHESFGMVFQEAAAAGLPVVATRINAIPEIVDDGRTGILVPPNDAAALVEALRTLIDAPDLRLRMGRAAALRVAAATPAAYAARLRALVGAVLHTHGVSAA